MYRFASATLGIFFLLGPSLSYSTDGPQPRSAYINEEDFRPDVEKAFQSVRQSFEFPQINQINLAYISGDKEECKLGIYASRQANKKVPAIIVCSQFRFIAVNYEQLFFIIAHEFAHIKLRHEAAILAKRREVFKANESAPLDYFGMTRAMAPFLHEIEVAADNEAVDVMQKAGLDPAHGAALMDRFVQHYSELNLEHTDIYNSGIDSLRQRNAEILKRAQQVIP